MSQPTLFGEKERKLINLKDASEWGSQYLNRIVTISNISYLLQYGRIKKYLSKCKSRSGGNNGTTLIDIEELKDYYDSFNKEKQWKEKLGQTLIGICLLLNTKNQKEQNMYIDYIHTKENLSLN